MAPTVGKHTQVTSVQAKTELALNDMVFVLLESIGKGGFGSVYKALRKTQVASLMVVACYPLLYCTCRWHPLRLLLLFICLPDRSEVIELVSSMLVVANMIVSGLCRFQ